ncbi:hypothetical protein LCGC14_3016450, partial [marine sediment metagenome]
LDSSEYYGKKISGISLFICAGRPEYEYIKRNYGYSQNEVKYTGFSRFDGYYNIDVKRQILIMPTWRWDICYISKGKTKVSDDFFKSTLYYQIFQYLLNNSSLIEILNHNNYQMVFYPHYEIQRFLHCFSSNSEKVTIASKDDFVVQTAFYMSPPKWHLGHVSWMYEVILSKINKNYEFYSKEFSEYLNSYYQQFGVPQNKGERGLVSRPTVDQIFEYFQIVNQRMKSFLQDATLSAEASKLIVMGFHHECQHQELLVYDLQHLLADQYRPVRKNSLPTPSTIEQKPVKVKGGLYTIGYNGSDYCYDIELPEHEVYLNDYKIDSFPVTNEQYLKFIEDGGYNDYKFRLSDGWEKVKENN